MTRSGMIATTCLVLFLLLLLDLPGTPASAAALIPTWMKAFRDVNGDGVQQGPDEVGLAGIAVSNGEKMLLTDSDGVATTTVDLVKSRFAWVRLPAGYQLTTPFYHRIHSLPTTDSVYFGLQYKPGSEDSAFTFVQMTDPQVGSLADASDLAQDLSEVQAAMPRPAFLVVTGDLVDDGGHREYFGYYRNATAGLPFPVYNLYGNHDAVPSSPIPTLAYEDSLGPTYYSFDHAGCHFVVLNSMNPPIAQAAWLASDLATIPAGARIFVLRHSPPSREELDQYAAPGVDVVLTGHWHATRARRTKGILDVTIAPACFAGIDRTPRGFQLVNVTNQAVTTEYRWGGLPMHVAIVSPANGSHAHPGRVQVRVNAYDSAIPAASVQAVLSGPAGPLPRLELARESPWSWAATWDATAAPTGPYTISVTVRDEDDSVWQATNAFAVLPGSTPAPASGADWPVFHGDPLHTGESSDLVGPPLVLAWASATGGATGLSSPVLREGVVYVGTGSTGDFAQCGVSAFDAASGELLWRAPTSSAINGTVAVSSEGVFAATVAGHLVALDPASGTPRWKIALGDTASRWEASSPTVDAGVVFAGRAPYIAARMAYAGTPLWTAPPLGMDFMPNDFPAPAVSAASVFVGTSSGFFAMDRATGTVKWSLPGYYRNAAVRGDTVFVVGGSSFANQYVSARKAATGGLVWSSPVNLQNGSSSPALSGNQLVVGSGAGLVCCFRAATGTPLWSFTTGAGVTCTRPYARSGADVCSSPAISGSTVYVGADDGYFCALDLATGALRWRYHLGVPVRGSPAVSGNAVFVTADDGCLYAFVHHLTSSDVAPPGSGEEGRPAGARLSLSCPNPLRPGDRVLLTAAQPLTGEVLILDARGRMVRRLYRGPLGPEARQVTWDGIASDGHALVPGIYFTVMRGGDAVLREKILILR